MHQAARSLSVLLFATWCGVAANAEEAAKPRLDAHGTVTLKSGEAAPALLAPKLPGGKPGEVAAPPSPPTPTVPAAPAAKPAETVVPPKPPLVAPTRSAESVAATKPAIIAPPVRKRPPRKIKTSVVPVEVHVAHWSYEGEGGPQNWGRLRPDYARCASGQRQSPIDIKNCARLALDPIDFSYKFSGFSIINNGHTVQIAPDAGNMIRVMGRQYELQQLHFHRPSEERIDGRAFDMVVHLVHKDDDGHLAVVAVLLDTGGEQPLSDPYWINRGEHPLIQTFWNSLPLEPGSELSPGAAVDLASLLPDRRDYYAYMGSLTTPPCTEGVLWLVLKQPVRVSSAQVAVFSRLYRKNARPIQPAYGRLIKESR